MKASEWIDRLRDECGWESDYRVAKELDVSASTLSKYRNKPESTMDDALAVRVAERLSLAPEIIIIDQVTERTKSEPARAALERALKKLGGAVAGAVIAAGLVAPAPSPATVLAAGDGAAVYYVKRRRQRSRGVLSTVARALQSLAPAPSHALAA